MWTDFFRSRYVKSLEKQLETSRAEIGFCQIKAAKDRAELQQLFESWITDLKSAHAEAWKHVIDENEKLLDLCERYRVALNPTVAKDTREAPPQPLEENAGSPWQRVLRREMKRQQEEVAHVRVKPADAPIPTKGDTNAERQSGEPA